MRHSDQDQVLRRQGASLTSSAGPAATSISPSSHTQRGGQARGTNRGLAKVHKTRTGDRA